MQILPPDRLQIGLKSDVRPIWRYKHVKRICTGILRRYNGCFHPDVCNQLTEFFIFWFFKIKDNGIDLTFLEKALQCFLIRAVGQYTVIE